MACVAHTGLYCTQYTSVYPAQNAKHISVSTPTRWHTRLCTVHNTPPPPDRAPARATSVLMHSTVHDSSISTHTRARPHDVCVDAFDRSRLVNLNTHRG